MRLRCEIERELSKVAQRETKSVLGVTNTSGDDILKNWDPLPRPHEDKFVTKTSDQSVLGSFFPHFPWGGQMKDPGNEVSPHSCQNFPS